jgi:tRNA pseudouridine38-40 synthase
MTPAMAEAAAHCSSVKHDFTTFRSAHCQSDSPVKTLESAGCGASEGERIEVHAQGAQLPASSGALDGRLPRAGRHGDMECRTDMAAALAAKDRSALGLNAPPDGLIFRGSEILASLTRRNGTGPLNGP